jgi:serine/threonine protein kinase/tetratricopeptide (TPR) repeat protein
VSSPESRWERLRHIVAEAAELKPWQRPRFLGRACGGDDELRREAESLLGMESRARGFLEDLAGRAGLPFADSDDAVPPGMEQVGPYRLIRRIGEGGMGRVYLAERVDGEADLRVAVKLLPPGLPTEVMRRRFAAERQILGRLAHPGIGRFLDGGVTPGGAPFLVMEYASGMPIDAYCDDQRLDVDQRLAVFLAVCDAVAYAHEHAVVHRDLKPSNVLVAADGEVKLLDFGIARVLEVEGADDSTTTWGASPVTLAYASPEQVAGEHVGYASDSYQLGVLLYLLLTGRLPLERVEGGSWAELARTVAARRAIPPSTAVGRPGQAQREAQAQTPEQRAHARRTGVAALRARLAGELDAILLKALRTEPGQRYASVAAFAEEIRRFRDGRPVAASLEVITRPAGVTGLDAAPAPAGRPGSPPLPRPQLRQDHVVVLPFAAPAIERLAYLRTGLVSLLSAALEDSGLQPVDPTGVLRLLGADYARTVSAPDARLRAEQFGAGRCIVGEVTESADGIRIRASMYGAGDAREPLAVATVEGTLDDLFVLVDRLAIELLCGSAPRHARDMARAAASGIESINAFKQFMRGEAALYAGDFFAAAGAFQRAVEVEPDFALGYYRLAMAAFWAHNLGLTRRFAAEAAARSDRLPSRERRLLGALEQYLKGHATAAEKVYRELLDESPADLEAAFLLGTLLFFHNALRGRSYVEARPFFERVLSIQPNHILSLLYLSTIVAREGDVPVLDVLTDRILDAYPDGGMPGYPLVARAQRAFASGRVGEQDAIIEELRLAGSLAAITAGQVVVLPHTDLGGAERVIRLLLADPGSGAGVLACGHVMLAHLELGRGRVASAARELDLAEALGSREAREFRALFALAPFLPAARAGLEALRAGLLEWDEAELPDAPPPIPHFAPHHGVHGDLRHFLLGVTCARLGEWAQAEHRAQCLDAAAAHSDDITPLSFAATIRAEAGRVRAGAGQALASRADHELGTSVERSLSSSFYAHGHARFLRGEMLHAGGRDEEALSWFGTFGDMSMQDVAYIAPARLREAEILRDRGDVANAAVRYRQFIRLWQDCDAPLQGAVDQARRSLAVLESAVRT